VGLIAQAALKVSADRILTLNPGHFTRLDPAIAQIVQVPSWLGSQPKREDRLSFSVWGAIEGAIALTCRFDGFHN
jgi:hypothetical protein